MVELYLTLLWQSHLPQEVADVGAFLFAGGDHEELGEFQVVGVGVEEEEHLADQGGGEGDVVVGA